MNIRLIPKPGSRLDHYYLLIHQSFSLLTCLLIIKRSPDIKNKRNCRKTAYLSHVTQFVFFSFCILLSKHSNSFHSCVKLSSNFCLEKTNQPFNLYCACVCLNSIPLLKVPIQEPNIHHLSYMPTPVVGF